jgi:hypothetical protein
VAKCKNNFFSYSGLLLYRTVKNPYVMALSKSQGKKYWFNTRTGVAAFNIPPDSIAEVELTTPSAALSRFFWIRTQQFEATKGRDSDTGSQIEAESSGS